jgi:ubiquinone/menaquinone biosynthesis C-methylase UbiE
MKLLRMLLLGGASLLSASCFSQYVENDWEERDRWMDTSQILEWAEVNPGDKVADIGCHEGYLSIHLAREVGDHGRVFAIDVREDHLQNLREHARARHLANISTVLGEYDDPRIPEAALDAVFIIDAYHEMDAYMSILGHVRKALKPGGRIVILEKLKDRAKGKNREQQVLSHTLSPHFVKKELIEAGFELSGEFDNLGKWENEPDKTMWLLIGRVPEG